MTVVDATVEVIVRDDGIGSSGNVREGHGLIGMRERVALLGGQLSVEPTPTGLTVSARLPAADENAVQA